MKPPDESRASLVRQWVDKAEEDFQVADHLLKENSSYFATIAFHCQQAAEKYLKAFLVWRQIAFPKTHDIEKLLDLVGSIDAALADSLEEAAFLSDFGVEIRYPGEISEVSWDDSTQAFDRAKRVRDAIIKLLPGKD
ncbi:MAG TPA: HEPN domain-containing protein [bacterium]|nr:HEPN domain-containing protein [bacterium]